MNIRISLTILDLDISIIFIGAEGFDPAAWRSSSCCLAWWNRWNHGTSKEDDHKCYFTSFPMEMMVFTRIKYNISIGIPWISIGIPWNILKHQFSNGISANEPWVFRKFGKTHVHPPFQIATEFVVTHPASRCTSVLELPGSSGCSTPRSQPVVDWIEAYWIHGISMAKSARNLLWKMLQQNAFPIHRMAPDDSRNEAV